MGLSDFSSIGYHALMTNNLENKGQADEDANEAAPLADRGKRALSDAEARRRERAAAKLRENLARRKHQARARRAGEAEDGVGLPAARPASLDTVREDGLAEGEGGKSGPVANSPKPGD